MRPAALCRLGRTAGLLPLFGDAGGPACAGPARRGSRDLGAIRRAVHLAAGAQPSTGLRGDLGRLTAAICRRTCWPDMAPRSRTCADRRDAGSAKGVRRLLGSDRCAEPGRGRAAAPHTKPAIAAGDRGDRRAGPATGAPTASDDPIAARVRLTKADAAGSLLAALRFIA